MPSSPRYSEAFKDRMVRRMCEPGGPTGYALAREVGVSTSALYEWAKQRRASVSTDPLPRRPEDWSAEEKFAAVLEAASLSDADLGAFLRTRGLHEAHLQEWRRQAQHGLAGERPRSETPLKKENQRLRREVARKDKALAEATALLVLSKKVRALWGDEGENT